MDTNFSPCFCSDEEEEDYIDMDLSFSSTNSSPQSKDFEFQMSSVSNDKGITTSSADELFYKGQLLPLHHPLRLKMVQKLLETSSSTTITTFLENTKPGFEEENHQETPFMTCSTNTSSSVESCRASCELNSNKNFVERSAELSSFINEQHPKNSWSKKMKLVKQSILGQKLKASRAYLKSLFCKSACNIEAENLSKVEESSNDENIKITRKKPFGSMGKSTCPTMSIATIVQSIDKEWIGNENLHSHRRSFSGAIKRHSATKRSSFSSSSSSSISSSGVSSSSSSSSSFITSGFQELHFLKRSSSATKKERSIEAAIAHCKKSQQLSESINNTFCSM